MKITMGLSIRRPERDRVPYRNQIATGRSRQVLMRFAIGRSVRWPKRDRVPCRDQIVTVTCVAAAVRMQPIGLWHSQMYNDYCYLHNLPKVQLGQFRLAIEALSFKDAHTCSIQVDFATLEIPDVVFLPPLHSLIMDSAVGTLIFQRAAR
ncbi:hypothetical protein Taro_046583, partial [Colocasia esculenta]|nr:hypothetical protein [Colocasia esculenta]